MELDQQILAKILATHACAANIQISDFQLHVFEDGCVLVNLKTGHAEAIYDDGSQLYNVDQIGYVPIASRKMV